MCITLTSAYARRPERRGAQFATVTTVTTVTATHLSLVVTATHQKQVIIKYHQISQIESCDYF